MGSRFRTWFVAAIVALLAAPAVLAHHSVAGKFDVSKSMTLTGVISKVDWINPHVYIHIDVKDENGAVTTWSLGTLPTAMMRRAGLSRESVGGKPGEIVTIDANPAREPGSKTGWISKITYADGHYIQLGRN